MLVRCSLLLVALVAAPAFAQVPAEVPGTGDDPIVALGVLPQVVDAPLLEGIAVRGGDPDDTKVLYEGFELPHLFHGRLRSAISQDSISKITWDDDVAWGRGTDFVSLAPRVAHGWAAQATLVDLQATLESRRLWEVVRGAPVGTNYVPSYFDGAMQFGPLTLIATSSTSARFVLAKKLDRGHWHAKLALSPMTDGDERASFDGRAQIENRTSGAGLQRIIWRAGIESTNTRWAATEIWTPDLGVWTSVSALLAPNIVARGGLRVDAFLRGHDIATQPRGSIEARLPGNTVAKLEAGAYRRPPERLDEITADHLHPERTSQVTAAVAHRHGPFAAQLVGYYIDRTHLIVRDQLDHLANTGFGTSKGIETIVTLVDGHWLAYVAASFSTSTRHDYFRGAERPADYDQPVRLDAIGRYRTKRWQVAARFSLSSGLPYTPVVESIYHSDTDTYEPLYGFHNTERLPLMHQLSIRADVRFSRHFTGFLDLHNAYAASTPVGYEYSYDYKRRLDVTLPILPFVGIRGDL